LGLPVPRAVHLALQAEGAASGAFTVDWLASTRGLGGKLRYLLQKLFPPMVFMRGWTSLARRGPLLLPVAYGWRLIYSTGKGGSGLLAWWRARKTLRRVHRTP
jgi:hypothetical protein